MKDRTTSLAAVIIALLLCFSFVLFWADFGISVNASPSVVYVPGNYEKIQWAINNASEGSTIIVASGIYYEHLTIDKALILQGNGQCIIDGNYTGDVIIVTANNVTIGGFSIRNSGLDFWNSGIHAYFSNYHNISYNTLINNGHGIWLDSSNQSILTNNNVSSNQCGIGLSFCYNNTIANNNVTSSKDCGIGLDYSGNTTITANTILTNGVGIWVTQVGGNTIFGNDILNNTEQTHLFNSTNAWSKNGTGNHWSDYTGIDANHDLIGDTPYIIDSDNVDNFPLMSGMVIPESFSCFSLLLLMIPSFVAIVFLKRKRAPIRAVS